MASYLRPRRGKKATAESQNIILKRGEVFFESPTGGVGTGTGRIKVGDGTTAYTSLPYFLNPDNFVSDISTATVTFTETSETDNATLLSRIVTGAGLNTIVASAKNLLSNLNGSVTQLNNDLDILNGIATNHNAIFRGKYLGELNSPSDYVAFRTAHGIDDGSYKDLYLGDYVKIKGTNLDNTDAYWMVAGFDLLYNTGGNATSKGVIWIPRTTLGTAVMNSSNVTTGGYKGSKMYTTTLPAVKTKMQNILSTYLLPINTYSTNTVNTSTGKASNWEATAEYCALMSEINAYGSVVFGGSYDVGTLTFKLPIFDFISLVEYDRLSFWLRGVFSASDFCRVSNSGSAGANGASNAFGVRPLVLTG